MIHFDCPKCLQQINAQDQQAGQRIVCPSCTTSLMVPAAAVGNFDDLFDSDEEVVENHPEKDKPPAVSNNLLDESIDSKSQPKVQPALSKALSHKKTAAAPVESIDPIEFDRIEQTGEIEESSDIFEDLQFPETTQQSDLETLNEIPTEVPFTVDPDKRLEIDGITDVTQSPESFSLKCPVCESHLFVTTHSVGAEVKCADCYSTILVPEPNEKQIEAAALRKSKKAAATERKPTAAKATPSVEVDPSFGLAPVNQDLLAPHKKADDQGGDESFSDDELKLEAPADLFGDLDEVTGSINQSSPLAPAKKGKTKSENADQDKIDPYRSRSSQVAKQKKRRKKKGPKTTSPTGFDFPKFEFDSLFGEMVNLVSTATVAVRSFLAAIFLAAGNVVGHFALSNYQEIQDPTMGDTAFMAFWRIGIGWTLFGLGTLFLWYTAGIIFRKTAIGERRIESWRIGPSTEWTSTFLLIGFSFAVAGSPLLMFGATWLSAPLRFFFALPMLVSVWFTQSPFKIISVDAFSRYRRQRPQWKAVWLVVFALASIAFTSGLLMAIPVPFLNIVTSLIGAVVLSFTTLGYAAVAGWHSGKVVEELN